MAFDKLAIFIRRLIVRQDAPLGVEYLLVDQKKIQALDLELGLTNPNPFGIIEIKDSKQAEEFYRCVRAYHSLASGEDLVKLRQFLLQETQRIIQERIQTHGKDIFAKEEQV